PARKWTPGGCGRDRLAVVERELAAFCGDRLRLGHGLLSACAKTRLVRFSAGHLVPALGLGSLLCVTDCARFPLDLLPRSDREGLVAASSELPPRAARGSVSRVDDSGRRLPEGILLHSRSVAFPCFAPDGGVVRSPARHVGADSTAGSRRALPGL